MALLPVNPASLSRPVGFSHGIKGNGELLLVAGQIGWNREGRMIAGGLVAQFGQALDNVLEVVRAAGGDHGCVARLTLYVVDKREYREQRREIGAAYRRRMGRHFPAMTLVEVRSLLEDDARIEIEAVALL
jgi:enamine deaminase RidA (YjgF/YER057c/UK114 family)